jgi:hypothetical protein
VPIIQLSIRGIHFFFSADCLFGGSLLKFVAIKTNGIDKVLLSTHDFSYILLIFLLIDFFTEQVKRQPNRRNRDYDIMSAYQGNTVD